MSGLTAHRRPAAAGRSRPTPCRAGVGRCRGAGGSPARRGCPRSATAGPAASCPGRARRGPRARTRCPCPRRAGAARPGWPAVGRGRPAGCVRVAAVRVAARLASRRRRCRTAGWSAASRRAEDRSGPAGRGPARVLPCSSRRAAVPTMPGKCPDWTATFRACGGTRPGRSSGTAATTGPVRGPARRPGRRPCPGVGAAAGWWRRAVLAAVRPRPAASGRSGRVSCPTAGCRRPGWRCG